LFRSPPLTEMLPADASLLANEIFTSAAENDERLFAKREARDLHHAQPGVGLQRTGIAGVDEQNRFPARQQSDDVCIHRLEHAQPGLHVCPQCDCELVQPVAWTEAAGENWELTLRCPNCMWVGEGVYHPRELERLEKKLDQGVDAILRDLQRLTHANMADQVDRFVEALRSDLILPEDF